MTLERAGPRRRLRRRSAAACRAAAPPPRCSATAPARPRPARPDRGVIARPRSLRGSARARARSGAPAGSAARAIGAASAHPRRRRPATVAPADRALRASSAFNRPRPSRLARADARAGCIGAPRSRADAVRRTAEAKRYRMKSAPAARSAPRRGCSRCARRPRSAPSSRRGATELLEDQRALSSTRPARRTSRRRCARRASLVEAELAAARAGDPERNPSATSASTTTTAAPATCASTTGTSSRATSAAARCCGPRAAAPPSPGTCGRSRRAARKPGIVITNGSVQAPEQLYWATAAALARAGYVVLTWDPQTQGRSDGPGDRPHRTRTRRRSPPGAFTEGTRDALDFFLSTPGRAVPAPLTARTPAGREPRRQAGPARGRGPQRRLQPAARAARPRAHRYRRPLARRPRGVEVGLGGPAGGRARGAGTSCARPTARPRPPRVPGLGMSGDYGIGSPGGSAGVTPRPHSSPPGPAGRQRGLAEFSETGRDTAQLNTRAGPHFESVGDPQRGLRRHAARVRPSAWYTIAWFDKHLKRERAADRCCSRTAGIATTPEAAVDPDRDGNHSPSTCARAWTSGGRRQPGALRGRAHRLRSPCPRAPGGHLLRARLRVRAPAPGAGAAPAAPRA